MGILVKAEMRAVARAMPADGPSLGVAPSGTDVGIGGVGGFFHHISQLAGEFELALTGHESYFDKQNISAGFGISQTGGHTYFILFFGQSLGETVGSQVFAHIGR